MLRNNSVFQSWLLLAFCCAIIFANDVKQRVGGKNDVDQSEWTTLSEKISESLVRLAAQSDGENLGLGQIQSAQYQVVAGKKYFVNANFTFPGNVEKFCDIEIWEQPWRGFQQVDIDCENKTYKVVQEGRSKRSVPGGRDDLEAEKWKELEDKITASLVQLSQQKDGETYGFSKINNAQKQIVAGIKYYANVDVTGPNSASTNCDLDLWEQPWSGFREFNIKCEEKVYKVIKEGRQRRSTEQLVGGQTDVPVEDYPKIESMVTESLVQLSQQPNGDAYKLKRIISCKQQVVAGVLYTVTAEFDQNDNAEGKVCTLQIWEQPWSGARQVDIACNDKSYKVVREPREKRSSQKPLMDDIHVEDETATHDLFQKFKLEFNREYQDSLEHDMRFRIFKQNLFLIEQLRKFEKGTGEYGITEFADLTTDEYFLRTGLRVREGEDNRIPNAVAEIPDIELPKSFDWREKNAVTAVKNQGNCGSCWAFSVTGNVEGVNAAKGKPLESFSEQELLDCDTVDGACQGGLPDDAYKAIERIGGLETEDEYPYKAHKGKCTFDPSKSHISVKGAVDLPKDEVAIAKYLVANGPVSIGINANGMQFYRGGVSHPWKALCRASSLDHGVLLVGFGVAEYPMFNKTLPYWIVKNSWGPKWGEQGYYRVYRGDNTCGVSSMASSAVLD